MRRPPLFSFFLAGCCLSGCGEPADPLDRKVEADTPAEYNEWNHRTLPQLPEPLRSEFGHAFEEIVIVSGRAGTARNLEDSTDPVCRRLNGRTVRAAILDGYRLESDRLSRRLEQE